MGGICKVASHHLPIIPKARTGLDHNNKTVFILEMTTFLQYITEFKVPSQNEGNASLSLRVWVETITEKKSQACGIGLSSDARPKLVAIYVSLH